MAFRKFRRHYRLLNMQEFPALYYSASANRPDTKDCFLLFFLNFAPNFILYNRPFKYILNSHGYLCITSTPLPKFSWSSPFTKTEALYCFLQVDVLPHFFLQLISLISSLEGPGEQSNPIKNLFIVCCELWFLLDPCCPPVFLLTKVAEVRVHWIPGQPVNNVQSLSDEWKNYLLYVPELKNGS